MSAGRSFGTIEGGMQGEQAFEDLLSATLDSIHRTAVRLCGDLDDANDLVQDAVLRGFLQRHQLRRSESGRSWLFRILMRTYLNRVRSERRRRESRESDVGEEELERALADWSSTVSSDWLERLADRERVDGAIRQLDDRLRAVLLLSDAEEFSHREIAAMLDIPEGTVASRLFRARRSLRDILTRDVTVPNMRKAR